MRRLKRLDRVAYIRFASVYRQFEDIEEFQRELARLEEASAGPLPGEEPLPGIGDEEGRPCDARLLDHKIMTGPSQNGRDRGTQGALTNGKSSDRTLGQRPPRAGAPLPQEG